jgi:beta-phosphoglucomutase family hydrolase
LAICESPACATIGRVSPARTAVSLGLPERIRACLFDLDGVLTRTASVHEAAWAEMFDAFLASRDGGTQRPFSHVDYQTFVDGKPRADGVRSFLASRGISVPEGTPDDPPAATTIHGLGRRKNDLFREVLARDGVEVFDGSVAYVEAVRRGGVATAVVSSSENARPILDAAGITSQFDVVVDGLTAAAAHLAGKPAPDTFLAAAQALGVAPADAAIFEDALAGVQAGRAGAFGFVVGVDRVGHAEELRRRGADVVVGDLAELLGRS